MLVTMIKKFARHSSLQKLILAASNFAKVSKSGCSLRLMILGWLKKKKSLGKFLLSVCSPSPSRRTTEETQCKMMQWTHRVPMHPAERGIGGPPACFPASGRISCSGRAILDRSCHNNLWGHQQPPSQAGSNKPLHLPQSWQHPQPFRSDPWGSPQCTRGCLAPWASQTQPDK